MRWEMSKLILDDRADKLRGVLASDEQKALFSLNKEPYSVYPTRTGYFIEDNLFIQSCETLSRFIEYYSGKSKIAPCAILLQSGEYWIKHSIHGLDAKNDEAIDLFSSLIFDCPGVGKHDLTFSPVIFEMVSKIIREESGQESPYIDYASELISAFVIATKVNCDKDQQITLEFNKPDEFADCNLSFKWLGTFSSGHFFLTCFKWILSSENGVFDYKARRAIVRSYINQHDSIRLMQKCTQDLSAQSIVKILDGMFEVLISNKTKQYFENMKMLRNEFVEEQTRIRKLSSDGTRYMISLSLSLLGGIYARFVVLGDFSKIQFPDYALFVVIFAFFVIEIAASIYFAIECRTQHRDASEMSAFFRKHLMIDAISIETSYGSILFLCASMLLLLFFTIFGLAISLGFFSGTLHSIYAFLRWVSPG